jgi:predicted ATPase
MLEFIHIKNFKTLLDASFPLGELNLFSGLNGMGKSTLVQSLLLLRQSYERNTLKHKGLLLNGDYVNLGTGKDALSSFSEQEEIIFTVKWSELDEPTKFQFAYQNDSDLLPLQHTNTKAELDPLSLFNANFQYLNASRLEPHSHHQLSEFHIRDLKSLGQHGEYAVHFIAVYGSREIEIEALRHPKAVSNTLLANIEAWMSDITPGLKIKAVAQPQFNSASLSYAFHQGKEITEDFKPQNVGFGLTYVLPVVTSILSASPNDLLIIENPESHLHPAGQSIMGKLCAMAAKNGVQLIIESHSDHFLNGVRVAVRQKMIDADAVKVFFLQRDIHSSVHASEVMYPKIDTEGRIDRWPDGFFDQWDKELDQLL